MGLINKWQQYFNYHLQFTWVLADEVNFAWSEIGIPDGSTLTIKCLQTTRKSFNHSL